MRKFFFSVAVAAVAFAGGPVAADQGNGPYYPTPSWDQQLSPSDRFVVLTNWQNQAVLDRETGLVWEASLEKPGTPLSWSDASRACILSTAGGRAGWVLPTQQELDRTLVAGTPAPGSNLAPLVQGSPFSFLSSPNGIAFWSATLRAGTTNEYYDPEVFNGLVGTGGSSSNDPRVTGPSAWCVQSHASGATAQ